MTPATNRAATAADLALGPELTIAQAAACRETLLQALACRPGDLRLDLSAVQAVDSAGLQLLLCTRRSLAARGAGLHLVARSAAVDEALATLGLATLLAPADLTPAAPPP